MTSKRLGTVVLIVTLLLAACDDLTHDSSGLPENLQPTVTAMPATTPTDVPEFEAITLPDVNWDEIEQFRAAMRPAYAGDIDAWAEANRYYIQAELGFETGEAILRGAQRVRYTNRSQDTLDQIVFRLYPNLPAMGGRMIVYNATVNGEAVEPGLAERNTVLTLNLAEPLKPGEAVEMTMQFSVAAERGMYASYGQFGYQQNVFSGPEWYPTLSVYDETTHSWFTERASSSGDAAFSETGLYETYLTVPENFVVAMSGTEIESIPGENGTKTVHYVSGPMRDSLLVAGPDFGILTDTVDDIKVNVFYYPGDEATAQDVLKFSTDSVRIFSETFGDYPFAELDVAETFNYTGIEYPGIVVISERNWERGNSFLEITTAHEVGHQWFYSVIGNNQVDQPWLDESLTSYTEYVYVRGVHGEEDGKEYVDNERTSYRNYRDVGVNDAVLGLPVSAYPDIYGLIIYTKGPLFFAELERVLGLEMFNKAVQHYYEQNKYQVVQSADVLNAFEEATGQELDEIFYEWVGDFPGLDPAVIEDSQANAQ